MKKGSLFTGAMGADLGAECAGMIPTWYCEIDRAAAGVIAYHKPNHPIYADITKFKPDPERDAVDIILGGSPCQDLSVAGKRAGLAGERSGLFREMVRICKRLRPRFIVWENVPGALSSNKGRDFAAVLRAFTGLQVEVPAKGWGTAGFLRTPFPEYRWNVAWRVLDSQYFGVPQRRRRIFLVASFGDGSCIEVLFEPESVRGDSPPSRETGERTAPALSSRTKGGGSLGADTELDGGLIPEVTGSLCADAHPGSYTGQDAYNDKLIPIAYRTSGNCGVMEQGDKTEALNTATDPCQNIVAFAENQRGEIREAETMPQLTTGGGKPGQGFPAVRAHFGVRRLSPRECERLQGWPDDHTLHAASVKLEGNRWIPTGQTKEQADSPRYKQAGNGVTASVMEWICRRIMQHEERKGI